MGIIQNGVNSVVVHQTVAMGHRSGKEHVPTHVLLMEVKHASNKDLEMILKRGHVVMAHVHVSTCLYGYKFNIEPVTTSKGNRTLKSFPFETV